MTRENAFPPPSPVFVVMRARNDMPLIRDTLRMVARQTMPHTLIGFDNDSTDGTAAELARYARQVINVPQGQYIPGRVLNQGMQASSGPFTVFLNSDCTPCDEFWLERLVAGFSDLRVAAVFGRQVPRPDCLPIFARDTEDTYGDGRRQKYWKHCFSMASSAIRREVWAAMPFDETLKYSEDIDWTWRARQRGGEIRYVPGSMVTHSHNYSVSQLYRRHFGEGRAEAAIFDWTDWEAFWLRYSLLPLVRQILHDWRGAVPGLEVKTALMSPVYRLAQMLGRREGFLAGRRDRRHHRRVPS